MSRISKFRVNAYDNKKSAKFYLRVRTDDGHLLCTFSVENRGLSYFRKGEWVLTPKANTRTLKTPHGFISMEELKSLFEELRKAKLYEGNKSKGLSFKREGDSVIIKRST